MEESTKVSLIILMALLNLVGGFYLLNGKKDSKQVALPIAWFFLSIFAAFLIFLFFGDSSVSGKVMGFQVGGALGGFVLIWFLGMKFTKEAVQIDQLRSEIHHLKKERDSQALEEKAKTPEKASPLIYTDYYSYPLNGLVNKSVGLVTGNITNVKGIDIWVNSENTNMQMARYYDRSISGIIRYYGAERHPVSRSVIKDTVSDELHAIMKDILAVEPTATVATTGGELLHRNGVRRIFHVASVIGQLGKGYYAIEQLHECVISCLEEADNAKYADENLRSILFPLMGTGTAKNDLTKTVDNLISAAIDYLENTADSKIEKVYFLAFTDLDVALCRKIFEEHPKVNFE